MMLVIVLWYFIHRFDLLEKVSFVIISSFFLYYFFYIFVPVAGPQFYFPAIGMDNALQGVFRLLATISITIRSCCPVRATNMAFSITS